jgi:catechol 2,3-dioxygenase
MERAGFNPRRLGHANLFASDLEASARFYSDVAGVELIRREPAISAAFHSNGSTHHDIGLIECSDGARRGRDGYVQPSSYRGRRPGLNHLGWEVDSEAALVAAIARAQAAGADIRTFSNHQISHSVYIEDPDGNYHEFYADVLENWREVFNLQREELVTEAWDWTRAEGKGPIRLPAELRHVPQAPFHPARITHATLAVDRFDEALRFFDTIAGLPVLEQGDGVASLCGMDGQVALVLVAARHGLQAGLQGVSFELAPGEDVDDAMARAFAAGCTIAGECAREGKRSVLVRDPDGLLVEFYTDGGQRLPLPDPARAGTAALWAFAG